jgi:hypothetical protein
VEPESADDNFLSHFEEELRWRPALDLSPALSTRMPSENEMSDLSPFVQCHNSNPQDTLECKEELPVDLDNRFKDRASSTVDSSSSIDGEDCEMHFSVGSSASSADWVSKSV